MSDSNLYSRLLFPKGHGYPLFHPQPSDDLPDSARRIGTEIGDVGVVTQDGCFDPIFNILRTGDDPANRFGVPAGFEQVVLRPDDILIRAQFHLPGSDISNTTVIKKRLDVEGGMENNVFLPLGAGGLVEVSANSRQTGLLLLPDGASRWDLRPQRVFRDHALRHGQSWYAFVNGDLGRMIGSGDLYLVTGVTKSTSWSVAALENRSGDGKVSLKLKAAQFGTVGSSYGWEWESASSWVDSGPRRRVGEESWRDNQTVFLRGFKVALRAMPLRRSPRVLSIVNSKASELIANSTFVPFSQPRSGSSSARDLPESAASNASGDSASDDEGPAEFVPNTYHPSVIINEYLLNHAMVAVIHDDEWLSVLDEADDGIPDNHELIRRILDKFSIEITSEGQGVCLRARSSDNLLSAAAPSDQTGQNSTHDTEALQPQLNVSALNSSLEDPTVDSPHWKSQRYSLNDIVGGFRSVPDHPLDEDHQTTSGEPEHVLNVSQIRGFDSSYSTSSISSMIQNPTTSSLASTPVANESPRRIGSDQPLPHIVTSSGCASSTIQTTEGSSPSPTDSDPPHSSKGSVTSYNGSLRCASPTPSAWSMTSSIRAQAFKKQYGRELNNYSEVYRLPADGEELDRLDTQHEIFVKVMGKYPPCLVEIMQDVVPGETKACLDLGCGSGVWIMEVAREFPQSDAVAVDLAPITSSTMPDNCRSEVDDINLGLEHFYGDFNVVHTQLISSGIKNYANLIDEMSKVLRPAGLMHVTEFDFCVYDHMPDGNHRRCDLGTSQIAEPWVGRWMVFARLAVRNAGGHPDAATHLHEWIASHPDLENVVYHDYWIPTSPHPTFDDSQKHIGAQMRENIILFLKSGRPLLLSSGVPEPVVDELQVNAEHELRSAARPQYIRLQSVYCRKKKS
ncbi:hypothetical protein B0H17DRAFT_1031304 [Mycena rosella]|uniref:Methyltransferase domain-containing protein n=1 Tax=Mycena rosella TaxID=1033263 RepID=A0AAD7H029_MYCRO|nr:hypothetical protein B0H17DRAFT_1031304 [Mycena rosella]